MYLLALSESDKQGLIIVGLIILHFVVGFVLGILYTVYRILRNIWGNPDYYHDWPWKSVWKSYAEDRFNIFICGVGYFVFITIKAGYDKLMQRFYKFLDNFKELSLKYHKLDESND